MTQHCAPCSSTVSFSNGWLHRDMLHLAGSCWGQQIWYAWLQIMGFPMQAGDWGLSDALNAMDA